MPDLQWLLPQLTTMEWFTHGLIFSVNLILLFAAKPIFNTIGAGNDNETRIKIFQVLNILVLVLHALDFIILRAHPDYEGYFIRLGLSLMALYGSLFCYSLLTYFSRKRFGKQKELDDKTIYVDTYSTRIVDLLLLLLTVFTCIYMLIKIWGADSLLEATGIIGITAAFLAFTSSIWGPDIISGLIILNSQILEDGDVVVVDGYKDEYIISKVSFIYIILYDVRNNHRTLVRNSRFIQSKIDNLSRIASTDGIRQSLVYNIGYPLFDGASAEERLEQLAKFKARVNRMFSKAFEYCGEQADIRINTNKPFEWALTSTGDFALEYTLWVYLERIPNTKVTATIRKHLMGTLYKVNEAVYTSSIAEDLDLSTPILNQVSIAPQAQLEKEVVVN